MDFNILTEENKPLLHRRDVKARIAYEKVTPSRADIRKEAAKQLKTDEKQVLVTKVVPKIGSPSANIEIRVYNDETAMKAVEHEFTMKRHGLVEDKKEAAAPKE
ncbi:hypothetical protein JW826_06420 [Candidatus Woesearchaeota archaeon]|nr:hypothetical protein [Candidatus Woesearchaeota archaeon]